MADSGLVVVRRKYLILALLGNAAALVAVCVFSLLTFATNSDVSAVRRVVCSGQTVIPARGALDSASAKRLARLCGEEGPRGNAGAAGPSGPSGVGGAAGPSGAAGADGDAGADGRAGRDGSVGGRGPAGPRGRRGRQGRRGARGRRGPMGAPGPAGPVGPAAAVGPIVDAAVARVCAALKLPCA